MMAEKRRLSTTSSRAASGFGWFRLPVPLLEGSRHQSYFRASQPGRIAGRETPLTGFHVATEKCIMRGVQIGLA
jgi:hypothetical protein